MPTELIEQLVDYYIQTPDFDAKYVIPILFGSLIVVYCIYGLIDYVIKKHKKNKDWYHMIQSYMLIC